MHVVLQKQNQRSIACITVAKRRACNTIDAVSKSDLQSWNWHAVICYKKTHHGRLPPKMRRLFHKATVEGCGFVTMSSTVQADYEHMVPGMVRHDLDLNPHLGPDTTGMDE